MSRTLTDPPKANKVIIKKKGGGRENEFKIDIDGNNFTSGQEYRVRFHFPACTTNDIVLTAISDSELTTGGYITPDTDCILSSILTPTCNVEWVDPSGEIDPDVPVEWTGAIPEQGVQTGFFQKILNFFKRLFGG